MNKTLRFTFTAVLILLLVSFLGVKAQKQDPEIVAKALDMLKNYKPPTPTNIPEVETPQQSWERFFREGNTFNIKALSAQKAPVQPSDAQYLNGRRNERVLEQLQQQPAPLSLEEQRALLAEKIQKGEVKSLQPLTTEQRMEEIQASLMQTGQKVAAQTDQEARKYVEEHKSLELAKTPNQVSLLDGYVFNDLNHNGVWDPLEPPMQGWRVYAQRYYQGFTSETVTDANGYYVFTDLPADYYHPYSQDSAGWHRSLDYPNWCYLNGADSARNINFGEWLIPPRSISGMKFNDLNKNGVKDTGEPGLSGWTIRLYENNSGIWKSTVTDVDGNYRFDSLMLVSNYRVYEDNQTGWYKTLPSGDYYEMLVYGESLVDVDFGNRIIEPNCFTGYKYHDLNHNGVRDIDEPGLPNWQINVSSYYTGFSTTVYTDAQGYYFVETNAAVDYYFISETTQPGWYPTTSTNYSWMYLYGKRDTLRYDFGNWLVPPGAIHGMKFSDLNNNGSFDQGEPGLPGWVIQAYRHESGQTFYDTTDANGMFTFENLPYVSYYTVSEQQQMDWVKTYPMGDYYFQVAGDTVININFGNYLPPPAEPLRVNTLPSYSVNTNYGNAVAGEALAVWGNVHGGVVPLRYVLDYGDGTVDSGFVTYRKYIGTLHSYPIAGYYTMTLTVRDNLGAVDVDQSVIRVFAVGTPEIRRNMAIEKGLLYDYLNQYPDGHFTGQEAVANTGASVLSFEENGHLPNNDINTDIYAEYVKLGLRYLFNGVGVVGIYPQLAGNPDSDGDNTGVYMSSSVYANGIALLAVIGAHPSAASAQGDTIHIGPYAGQTYYDFIVDALDQIAFSQTDTTEWGRGGWRYYAHVQSYGNSDNSAVQWHSLVIEAAEKLWGLSIQPFVKDELLKWLQYSQDGSGGFGYTDPGNWNNVAKTGSGIGSYAALGSPSTTGAVVSAINFLDTYWNTDNFGNFYAMYAVKKGMSIIDNRSGVSLIGAHNWRDEYNNYVIGVQNSDGSWNAGGYVGGPDALGTSFGILILTPGVSQLRPVAVITPISSKPPSTSFAVDGTSSHHRDPSKAIVEYLWDWNDSDGVNWASPDAFGPNPTNPGYSNEGTYRISLRVKDNNDPALFDFDSKLVTIQSTNNPPVAVPIPPDRGPSYAAHVDEPILLDARASWDPDSATGDHIVAYRWDLNGNGNFYDLTDATTDTVTVVYHSEYNGQVGLRVYDTHGDSSTNIAYLTIVASRKDIYVEQFTMTPGFGNSGDSVEVRAIFKSDDASNVGATSVLIRFYDENPLTTGSQIGGDYIVNLPIGERDTVVTKFAIPVLPTGNRNFYVYLDANASVAEWNEINNFMLFQFHLGSFASITGYKFQDLDGNGIQDQDDGRLAGWKIILDGPKAETTYTDADGMYGFDELSPGTYTVREEVQDGWIQTYPENPNFYTFDITSDSAYQEIKFGNFKLCTIYGMKFNDTDRDSSWNEREPGIPGWLIRLISSNDTITAFTDQLGEYTFIGIGPGTYRIEEEQLPGWTQTAPSNPSYYEITTSSGQDYFSKKFGNYQVSGISGMKFNDLNGNGQKDQGEPGLPNWGIVLNGIIAETTYTNANGEYTFYLANQGIFTVTEIQQSGWVQTTPDPDTIYFLGSQMVTDVNFGNFKSPTISGFKFMDANGNGVRDENEVGLQGWTIKATKGATVKSKTTGEDGSYSFSFSGAEVGTWVISEELQSGWTQTYPEAGTYTLVVESASEHKGIDFGNFQGGSISGKKYEDIAGDSTTSGDPTMNGWKILLYKDEVLLASTTTSGTGDYEFSDLSPGQYVIAESLQTGWMQTMPATGSYTVDLTSGANITGKDFANFKLGTISGTKFNDINGDSVKAAGDPGLANWEIVLSKDQTALDTVLTDAQGNYSFTGLSAGTYMVTENVQDGWYQTLPSTGYYSIVVTSQTAETGKDFGNFKYGSVSGLKFFDRDSNGTRNEISEEWLAGAKIVIYGTHTPADTVVTDSSGVFNFNNLPADIYTLTEALKLDWRQTYPANGATYTINMLSGLDTGGYVFGNFHMLDTGKFRTFLLSDYHKASTATMKSGYIRNPSAGNVRDTVFRRKGFGLDMPSDSGYLRIGVKRPDSALVYGWFWHRWTTYKKAAIAHWIYNLADWGTKRDPKTKTRVQRTPANYLTILGEVVTETYFGNAGNHLTMELTTLKTNIAASDLEITPKGFGDLIYLTRTATADTVFNYKNLRQIALLADTALTMGRKIIREPNKPADTLYRCDRAWLFLLDSTIAKINAEFRSTALKLDTISTKPLKLKGVKALYKVLFLVRDSAQSLPLAHFAPDYSDDASQPATYRLDQNYPNPFNPLTTVQFELPARSRVSLKIFNILGQEVQSVFNDLEMEEGVQSVEIDASSLASGVYFYRLDVSSVDENGLTKSFSNVKKMVLVK